MTKKLPNQLSRPLFSVCRSFLGKLGTTVSKGMQVFVVMLIFTAAMLTNQSTKAATQVYLIPQSQLVNLASTCGTGSYYNGCSSLRPGFTWTDVLSGGTTITSVTIEFNVGVECGPTLHTTELNGAAEANFTTSVNWCNCTGSGQPAFSMPGTLANYVVGGSNTFTFDSPLSTCVGLAQDAAIGGQYARITVDYVSSCVTPVVSASPATSCSSPLTTDLVGISAGNNIDWFDAASGGTFLGSAASGSNFPQTLSGTTTYYAEASGGSCITSTPRVPVLVSIGVPPAPSSVIAVEDSICPLLTSSLSAMAPGYTIDWYNASSGGTLLGSSASGASFVVSPSGTTTYYAEASASGCTSATRTAVTVYVTLTSPAAPFGGSASPSVICPSALSDISASAATAIIDWYDAPTGGTLLATVSSGSPFTVSPSVTTTYYAQANEAIPGGTTTFNYTGAAQSFTVPAGVLSLTIDARGGQGGVSSGFTGGLGARMEGTFAVTPGQVLTVVVGAQGVRSYNSGSGGGGSGVVDGATPMIIAGGGGGASENGSENGQAGQITTTGGNSSGPGGSAGSGGQKGYVSGDCGWAGGGGGFSGDGYGGDGGWDGGPLPGVLGTVGGARSWLNGGAGGSNGGCSFSYPNNGVFGCGGGGSGSYGAGGGGGYSGGGGGHYTASSGQRCGGGGGSLNTGTSQTNTAGFQSGNGQVIITSALVAGCVSLTRLPVTVTIGTPAAPLSATVSDDTICPSDAVILTGIAPGHDINWYDVASGGTALGTVATGVGFSVSPTVTTTYYAETSLGGCSSATRTSVTVYVVLPPAPLSASASPSSICPGAISLLSAVASGMYINFYDAASGGTLIGGAISGASVGVSPLVTTTYYASAITLSPGGSVSYPYTGAMESFTVPIGATSISIEAFGAQGRSADGSFVGGLGARMKGDFAVTGGDQLIVLTGAQGLVIGGSGGGGGGSFVVKVDASSSDVIASGPFAGTSVTPLLIAGGGAGTRTSVSQNGNPGVTTNTATTASGSGMTGGGAVSGATPGLGGSVSSSSWGSAGGGFRGTGASDGSFGTGGSSFLNGGAGGVNACSGGGACGGFGSAGSGGGCDGGGGGGGYTGGDGGRVAGGGGSFNTGSAQSNTDGVRSGNGLITITWNNILGCESATRTPVTVTVTGISPAAPTPVTVTPTDICVSGTVLLNAIAAGDNINWYVADSAGILLGTSVSGVDFSQYTDSTTIFYAEAISSFGCQSLTRTPVTVVMHPALVAPTITGSGSAITCSGSVTISAIGSGTSLDWFDASSGGTLLCGGCASYTTPTISTSTSYWVETTDGICTSPRTQVDLVVTPYPAPTITGSGSAITCSGSVTISAIGSGTSLDWFDASSGGTLLCGGCASYTTPTISTSTSYWVETTDGVCSSPRTQVDIVVTPYPAPTITGYGSAISCSGSVTITAIGSGSSLDWYDAPSGGTNICTGCASYATPTLFATTTYYVETGDGVCFSPRTAVTIIVEPYLAPTITGSGSAISCSGSVTITAIGSGTSLDWYNAASGGTSLCIGCASYTTPTISTSTTYWVEATNGVCTSPRTAVTILVVIPFGLPTVTSTPAPSAICAGSSIDLNAVTTSTTINWYDAATGGTLLTTVGTGVNYTVSPTVTTSYWAEATDGGACFAGREKITVIVTSVTPPTPVTATASTICIGSSSLLNGTSAGNSINWYTDSVGGTSIGTSASAANFSVTPSSTTTYYAEAASPAFSAGTATFAYTGAMQSFTVPAGVVSINIDALGAQGRSGGSFVGGLGARMSGNFNVTPGDQLIVLTGQQGIRIGNSGGGGGGSFVVKVDSTSIDMITAGPFAGTSVTPLVIAGGGAGIRGSASQNGNPGVTTNTATTASGGSSSGGGAVSGTTPGLGGIASSSSWGSGGGGFRGDGASDGSYGTGGTSFLSGGAGGLKSCSSGGSCGGFGSGGSGGGCYGGGGGGGYTGGDGGWIGGGGGSYNIGTGQVNTDGVRSGNGLVTITWSGYSGCASPTRTAVTVTVNTAPVIVTHPTPTTTLTIGSYFSLYVVATGAVSSYQWYRGGTLLSGATDDTLIIPSVISTDAGNYTCRVAGCGTVISTIGVLSITISLAGDSRCVPVRFEPTGVFAETAERNLGVANPDCDTIVSNNSASSNETGEPFGSAAGAGGYQRTMWYTMKSPTCAANSVRFSTNTSPTDFNSRLTAYHRVDPLLCTGAMVELASIDDDGFGSMTDAASVTLLPGTGASSSSTFLPGEHIYAQVSGFDGASGNYGIVVDVDAPAITAGTVTSGTIEVNLDYAALHAYGVPFSSFYLRSRKVGDPLTRYTQKTISSSSTTATISGLISGASYDVWMMYRCSAGDRWVSSKITVTTIAGCSGPIAAPTVVASSTSAGVACKSVDIGWTPSSLATMYTVRWALASTPARYSSRSVTAPASSYTTGAVLVSGTNYICWVITTCVGGATFTSPVTTFTTCGAIPRMSDPDASTEDGVYAYNNLEFHHMGINDISMSIDVQNGEVNLTRVEGSGNESGTPLITAIKMIDNMSIHPNPARTAATLSYLLPSESESMSITIYDAQGKEVSSELISDPSLAGDYIINLSNYASGLYFVKAQTGNFSETRKLVVDKD